MPAEPVFCCYLSVFNRSTLSNHVNGGFVLNQLRVVKKLGFLYWLCSPTLFLTSTGLASPYPNSNALSLQCKVLSEYLRQDELAITQLVKEIRGIEDALGLGLMNQFRTFQLLLRWGLLWVLIT